MRVPAWLVVLALPSIASAQPAGEDLAAVLGGVLYPVQIMAYCHAEVAADPVLQNAGRQWLERNGELLANLEAMATAAGVSESESRAADEQALADITAMVASQGDKPNYCRFVAGVIDAGHFDIDQREDLAPALKRIFGIE